MANSQTANTNSEDDTLPSYAAVALVVVVAFIWFVVWIGSGVYDRYERQLAAPEDVRDVAHGSQCAKIRILAEINKGKYNDAISRRALNEIQSSCETQAITEQNAKIEEQERRVITEKQIQALAE